MACAVLSVYMMLFVFSPLAVGAGTQNNQQIDSELEKDEAIAATSEHELPEDERCAWVQSWMRVKGGKQIFKVEANTSASASITLNASAPTSMLHQNSAASAIGNNTSISTNITSAASPATALPQQNSTSFAVLSMITRLGGHDDEASPLFIVLGVVGIFCCFTFFDPGGWVLRGSQGIQHLGHGSRGEDELDM
mmetsp:Transcript_76101/g.144807  ORF Transcript_76101/g.144807 Transcript_76101/m.144807 type:complete len:194 (-) Transcript_76101:111-692(-)